MLSVALPSSVRTKIPLDNLIELFTKNKIKILSSYFYNKIK
jgi:hypothetical protein